MLPDDNSDWALVENVTIRWMDTDDSSRTSSGHYPYHKGDKLASCWLTPCKFSDAAYNLGQTLLGFVLSMEGKHLPNAQIRRVIHISPPASSELDDWWAKVASHWEPLSLAASTLKGSAFVESNLMATIFPHGASALFAAPTASREQLH